MISFGNLPKDKFTFSFSMPASQYFDKTCAPAAVPVGNIFLSHFFIARAFVQYL